MSDFSWNRPLMPHGTGTRLAWARSLFGSCSMTSSTSLRSSDTGQPLAGLARGLEELAGFVVDAARSPAAERNDRRRGLRGVAGRWRCAGQRVDAERPEVADALLRRQP